MASYSSFPLDLPSNFILKKDPGDDRDLFYDEPTEDIIPRKADLRIWCSPVECQMNLGSCVSQAIVGAFELMINKFYPERFQDLSRLFVYYNARLLENSIDLDSGVYLKDGIKAVHKFGVCNETIWPYLINKFDIMPSHDSYLDATSKVIDRYHRVETINDIKKIVSAGYPVVAGIEVFGDFDNIGSASSVLPMPMSAEESLGGHAIVIVGYDDDFQYFICRNSYGEEWGDNGYFYMPYEYAELYIWDAWMFDIELDI
jgi:C1A family cysteine protease